MPINHLTIEDSSPLKDKTPTIIHSYQSFFHQAQHKSIKQIETLTIGIQEESSKTMHLNSDSCVVIISSKFVKDCTVRMMHGRGVSLDTHVFHSWCFLKPSYGSFISSCSQRLCWLESEIEEKSLRLIKCKELCNKYLS